MSKDTNYLDAAHLLRRAGFGESPSDIQLACRRGLPDTLQQLLSFTSTPDPIDDDTVIDQLKIALPPSELDVAMNRLPILIAQVWWLYRMVATRRPLEEKMVLFWHNHFTSADSNGTLMVQQNQLYRRYALGNFRDLTLAASKNPEMLKYLNNAQNFKAHPNENFARELMELFTCGRVGSDGKPNYTEDDIKASARAFSGWNSRHNAFYYNPRQHDDTDKTFMGRTGDLNGDDIVDILIAMPQTAYYMCRKLFQYFAYDNPEHSVMDSLVSTYFDSGYEISPIVEQILSSTEFYSEKARGALIKSPAEFVVGSVRMLALAPTFAPAPQDLIGDAPGESTMVDAGAAFHGPKRMDSPVGRLVFLDNSMRNMGQELLHPPTVKGWDGGEMWINTGTLQAREKFAGALANVPELAIDGLDDITQGFAYPAAFGRRGKVDQGQAQAMIDAVFKQLGPLQVSDATRQAILDYASNERSNDRCLRGIVSLAMGTTEYQVS